MVVMSPCLYSFTSGMTIFSQPRKSPQICTESFDYDRIFCYLPAKNRSKNRHEITATLHGRFWSRSQIAGFVLRQIAGLNDFTLDDLSSTLKACVKSNLTMFSTLFL